METHCVSSKKNTVSRNSSVRKNKQNILMLFNQIVLLVARKKSKFIKNQELCNFNNI